jgi:uncharacterized membrane protein
VPWVGLALAACGLGISVYLTIVHYSTSVTLACTNSGVVNCEKVTTSPESRFLGAPVPLFGLAFFLVMLLANLPAVWRRDEAWIRFGRLAVAAGGVLFVLYLVYAELFRIDAICLWCSAVHVITGLLFGLVCFGTALGLSEPDASPA